MRLTVTVLHNVSPDMFFRYGPDSRLHHAHTFEVEADSVDTAANLVWTLTNVGDANELRQIAPHEAKYADEVTKYRARGNRSLSVSDVLVFHEGERPAGCLVVAGVGHDMLEAIPSYEEGTNGDVVSKSYLAHQEWMDRAKA